MHGTGVDEVLAALGGYGRRVAKEYLRPCFKPLPAFCRAEIIFPAIVLCAMLRGGRRSEEHTSELQSLMRISYAVFCFNKKNLIYDPLHYLICIFYTISTSSPLILS